MMGHPYYRPRMKPLHRLIARLALDLIPGEEIQLLPDGEFRARDGRPGKGKTWRLDARIAERLIAQASARATPYVIDYEHQTLRAAENGKPAPAAGWFKRLAYRPGQGLYATDVQWTDEARAMIASGAYRYLSPVFAFDAKGAVLELLMAAITNVPALDQLDEVSLKAAASLIAQQSEPEQESDMSELLKKLIATLGLANDATDEQAISACAALKTKADQVEGLQGEIAVLKTKVIDPTKHVPVELLNDVKSQFAALSMRLNEREVEDLITGALAEGKLATQAEQDYARTVGKADVAALKSYIAAAPAISALKRTQSGGTAPAGGAKPGELTEDQLAICRHMALDPEEYKKQLAAA